MDTNDTATESAHEHEHHHHTAPDPEGVGARWLPEPAQGPNRFRQKGSTLVVLASVSHLPNDAEEEETKKEEKLAYQLVVFREDRGKTKRPNVADVSRVKKDFLTGEWASAVVVFDAEIDKSHHIMVVAPHD